MSEHHPQGQGNMSGIERYSVSVSQMQVLQPAVLRAKGLTQDSNGNLMIEAETHSRAFSPDLWESVEVKRLPSTTVEDDV
jgi:hypothetical protein